MAGKARSVDSTLRPPVAGGDRQVLQNLILLELPARERAVILDKAELVELPARTVLTEMDRVIEHCYFMNRGVASIIRVLSHGKSVEVGLTGNEGFVGLPVIAGFQTSPTRAIIQIAGSGYRMRVPDFRRAMAVCPKLVLALHRYSQELSVQAIQIAACNRLHEVDQRLARWLLMTQDRMGESSFTLTQEFISHMLGSRRASVTVAAGILQRGGLINYTRGRVTIKDRPGLEAAACECYAGITQQLKRWRAEFRNGASRSSGV
jgi:CRP-like cAMP-binding protein